MGCIHRNTNIKEEITYNHKKYFLGVYENIKDAEKARKEAETKFYQIHNRREN